jgi:hypothetical protein
MSSTQHDAQEITNPHNAQLRALVRAAEIERDRPIEARPAGREHRMTVLGRACVERVGPGFTIRQTYLDWAAEAIQETGVARDVAQKMLDGTDPYEWNPGEPEFHETFQITDRPALEAQLGDEQAAEQAAAQPRRPRLAMAIFPLLPDGRTRSAIEECSVSEASGLLPALIRATNGLQRGLNDEDGPNPDRRATVLELTIELVTGD